MASTSGTESTETPISSLSSKEAEKPQIEPLRLPTIEEIRGQDIWNNCAVRSVVSGVLGGGLGFFMGLFFGALDNPLTNPLVQEEMTAKQQFIYTAKQMGKRSISSAKTFALMGLIFSAAECVVEKARAKHDMTNTVVAGCATGGSLSAKAKHVERHFASFPLFSAILWEAR
ncbi:PREDICTED: mitochondrial import inner membrane translocase subunit TIM22-4-like isoform X2 [Nelumbo nucifera]|uniref:Mitochondrial import inner membrane translocase subunit TIM22-4-like isoform X2 n=1 Tax=Nelumbo nucifera TaxID=4432 RepID=A0A1U7Z6Y0_NELNU|nr:PREDICTED: mitochondrial import inner membrane translocase subunit TIM22-4-like isoform X2 [Nelumbo nucifera]